MGAKAGLLAAEGNALPIVSPQLALCGSRARRTLCKTEEATSRRRPRNGEDGSSAWALPLVCVHTPTFDYYLENGFSNGFSSLCICVTFSRKNISPHRCAGRRIFRRHL